MSAISLHYELSMDRAIHQMNRTSRINQREILDEFGAYMVSQIVKRFNDQKTWDGRHFFKSKAAVKRKGKTLLDTGALRDSYTYVLHTSGSALEIGSNLVYAAIHHFGGKAGRKIKGSARTRIQANPVLGLNTPNKLELRRIYHDHVGFK